MIIIYLIIKRYIYAYLYLIIIFIMYNILHAHIVSYYIVITSPIHVYTPIGIHVIEAVIGILLLYNISLTRYIYAILNVVKVGSVYTCIAY